MTEKLFDKKIMDASFPKKTFFCDNCNGDLLEPIMKYDPRAGTKVQRDRAYTYYFGKRVCIPCYHELAKKK